MSERAFGPVVVRRRLGSELRRLREQARLSLEFVARELEVSPSKISRLENAQSPAKLWDVRNLLTLYGATDEDYRRRAERWVSESRAEGWWHAYSDASPADLDHYVSLEAEAAEIRSYCSPFLHGLLQTPGYAEAMLREMFSDLTGSEIEGLVRVRVGRQDILAGDEPPEVHVVVDESVLRRRVGSSGEMRAQLRHLAELIDVLDVRVRPFDAGAHIALFSPFTIFLPRERDIDPTVVNLESAYHDAYFESDTDVDRFVRSFEELQHTSLSREESKALVRRLAGEGPVDER